MRPCTSPRRMAGTAPNSRAPASSSGLSRRSRLDAVIPGLQVGVFRLDADVHNTGKRHSGEGVDIRCGKFVAADVVFPFQLLVQEVHKHLHTLPAFFAPFLDRVHAVFKVAGGRSEEHTSELQSRENLVCRLLLEKKKNTQNDSS